jgi:hypothetical protein
LEGDERGWAGHGGGAVVCAVKRVRSCCGGIESFCISNGSSGCKESLPTREFEFLSAGQLARLATESSRGSQRCCCCDGACCRTVRETWESFSWRTCICTLRYHKTWTLHIGVNGRIGHTIRHGSDDIALRQRTHSLRHAVDGAAF